MSGRPLGSAASVGLVFAAAALLAAAAALPGRDRGSWRERLRDLERAEGEMTAAPRLHSAAAAPAYPPPASFCGTCHPLPPHGGGGSQPAFLNHHSTRMDCLVCHWARISGERPEAVWEFPGGPEGPEDTKGREAPFLRLAPPPGAGERDGAALRGAVAPRQQCFDRGPSCRDCHGPGRFAPYLLPGKPDAAARAFEALPDFFTLPKGEKWYFPQRR